MVVVVLLRMLLLVRVRVVWPLSDGVHQVQRTVRQLQDEVAHLEQQLSAPALHCLVLPVGWLLPLTPAAFTGDLFCSPP